MGFIGSERLRVILSSTLAVGLLLAGTAQGHDKPYDPPGRFYFGGGVGAEYVDLANISAVVLSNAGGFSNVGHTDEDFWTESVSAFLGYADLDGTVLGAPVGTNARIELLGRFSRGDSNSTEHVSSGPGLVGIGFPSDPTSVVALPSGGAFTAISYQKTDLKTWDADLLYRLDIEATPMLVFTPFVGLTYTHYRVNNDFFGRAQFPVGPPTIEFAKLDERTTAHYGGVALGGDLRFVPFDFLALSIGARGDLMGVTARTHTELNSGPTTFSTETDRDSDFAARLTTSLGVTLTAGPVALGLEGFARWMSYAPYVRYPLSPTGDKAHIDSGEMWGTGGRATLTFYFR